MTGSELDGIIVDFGGGCIEIPLRCEKHGLRDFMKCPGCVESEVLKKFGKWLRKRYTGTLHFGEPEIALVWGKEVQAFERGETPEGWEE